jgi:hypothetical protein
MAGKLTDWRIRILAGLALVAFGPPSAGYAQDISDAVTKNQQNVMIGLWIHDNAANGFDAHFRYGSQYQTRQEVEEIRDYNLSLLLAKSSQNTYFFDDNPYFERLPGDLGESVKKDFLEQDWEGICEKAKAVSTDAFAQPINEPKNAEVFLLTAARFYQKNAPMTAVALNTGFVDEDTAVDIGTGERPPLTCEEVWSLKTGLNLVKSAHRRRANDACARFQELTQCMVDLEKRVAELLPAARESGATIENSWTEEYFDADGSFLALISK